MEVNWLWEKTQSFRNVVNFSFGKLLLDEKAMVHNHTFFVSYVLQDYLTKMRLK